MRRRVAQVRVAPGVSQLAANRAPRGPRARAKAWTHGVALTGAVKDRRFPPGRTNMAPRLHLPHAQPRQLRHVAC
jgi:hypothetical protein